MNATRRLQPSNGRVFQRGLSLIEILVSLTIGAIILAAIGMVYVNSANLIRQKEDQSELNDPSRVVMQILRHDLMQAGYVDVFDLQGTSTQALALFRADQRLRNIYVRDVSVGAAESPLERFFVGLTPVFGCDGAMQNTPDSIVTSAPPAPTACGAASDTRQSLRVAYQAVPNAAGNATNSLTPADATLGVGLDCLQQNPPAGTSLVINQYYVPLNTNVLMCHGSGGGTPQQLAQGVEEFVLRYQVASPPAVGAVVASGGVQARYLSASDVSDGTINPLGWAGVTAVEICVVSATAGPAAIGTSALQPTRPTCERAASGEFDDNVDREAGDARLWKRFTTVISLRNAVYATPL